MILDVTTETFATEVLERSRSVPVVVDFWAAWCQPCRSLGPVLEAAVRRQGGQVVLAKVDADANYELTQQYGVQSIPAVKAFRDGRVVSEFVGAQPPQIVEAWLAGLMPTEHEQVFSLVRRALADDRLAEAEALLRRHLKQHPTDVAAIRMLAEVALRLGQNEDAGHLLARCLERAPNFAAARYNYAIALHLQMQPADALRQIDRALAAEPHITTATLRR